MRCAERIVNIKIRQTRQLLRELFVVGFFLGMKAKVLQKQGLALFQLQSHFFRLGSNAIRAESHVLAARQFLIQNHAQPLRHRLQTHLGIGLALGPSQMRGQNQPRPVPQRVLNRGQSFADTRVIHDASIFQRNIEVDAHEDHGCHSKGDHGWKAWTLAGRPLAALFKGKHDLKVSHDSKGKHDSKVSNAEPPNARRRRWLRNFVTGLCRPYSESGRARGKSIPTHCHTRRSP
jgi:hypothetical protein